MSSIHLHDELAENAARVSVSTRYGEVIGARSTNGCAVFLEIPFALPPGRFEDPEPLPDDFRYPVGKEYIREDNYAFQPSNDGQARGSTFEDKVGYGKPTENPLLLNIVTPSSFPSSQGFPVKVYFHGGFLQFGSPHGVSGQAQYIAAARNEVWVNIGYRLSAFGFLACDEPKIKGNFGFKDQWMGLLWVRDNIARFGGDPNDIQVSGLSAGAHSVHQLVLYASRLPPGQMSPFHSAILQSNAMVCDPKTAAELRPQFLALCGALDIEPTLSNLRQVSAESICRVIETDALGAEFGTFRACADDEFIPSPMAWQKSPDFAPALRAKGIKSLVIGDLTEEWYLYSIACPIKSPDDIVPNLKRCYQDDLVEKMIKMYPSATPEESERRFGEILADWQVHLPVRLLAKDLFDAGFPVLRYEIRWTPEQNRAEGYVTHASDRALWALRLPNLEPDQVTIAHAWLDRIAAEVARLEAEDSPTAESVKDILVLDTDKTIKWTVDSKWDAKLELESCLGRV
ncbi:Alpha/Beta hydrolase protein [Mycena floridula]|nr:Alpha/Beta hydrolase protein [Mycena floridula]